MKDVNRVKNLPSIKLLDTDRLYNDSPNEGEPGCVCSRCHKPITAMEKAFRVPIDQEVLYSKDAQGEEKPYIADAANGKEFRLCPACVKNLK